MSRLLTVREIAERVLRKVGTFSIRDPSADPGEMDEARYWLDLIVGHVAASQRTWWLVRDTVSFALTANTISYDLNTVLGLNSQDDRIQFPVLANVKNVATGAESPLHIVRRSKYEDIDTKTQTGTPELLYIDRDESPTAKVWPVAVSNGLFTISLAYQTWGPDLKSPRNPEYVADMRSSWNLFLITRGAAEVGDGPIARLPVTEIASFRAEAKTLLDQLWAYDNQEQTSEPRQTAYTDF